MSHIVTSTTNRWYHNGVDQTDADPYRRLGYYNGPYVVRYKFKTPPEGASKINISKGSLSVWDNSINAGENIMFFVTTNPDSHKGACYIQGAANNPETDGIFTISNEYGSGSVDKILLPNTDYYLYFFPAYNSYGFYFVYDSGAITITLDGAAGIAHTNIAGEAATIQPLVKMGGSVKNVVAYTKINGEIKVFG